MINIFSNLNLNNSYSSSLVEGGLENINAQIADNNQILSTLKALLPGQTLEAQLVNQEGDSLQLLIGGNTLLNTTLDSGANLSVGQNISFEVKSNNNGHLILRPLHTNVSNEATAIKALDHASVQVTEDTIKMVDSLMKEGMPINKDVLQSMNRAMHMYPDADIDDLVMLHKLNLPINNENISQMHLYNNNNQWMMSNIDNMTDGILDLLSNTSEADLSKIVDELKNAFVDKTDQNASKTIFSENDILNNNKDIKQMILDGKDIFDILKNASSKDLKDSNILETLKDRLKSVISDKFLMEPSKVSDKEYVKSFYEKTLETANRLENFLNSVDKGDSPLAKNMTNIKNNISFIDQMNELYNYVQLPLKMAGSQAQGDLYVYSKKNKHSKDNSDEPLTALLHLSMECIGNIDVFLKLQNEKLSTDFSLEKEDMIDFISQHIDELNSRLIKKGYNVTTTVGKLEGEQKNVIDDIRSESNNITILSNQSFDARA